MVVNISYDNGCGMVKLYPSTLKQQYLKPGQPILPPLKYLKKWEIDVGSKSTEPDGQHHCVRDE